MMPTARKRRLILVLLVVAAAAVAIGLAAFALQRNMNYLFTPSQVLAGEATGHRVFRLGGMVKAGSIERSSDSLDIRFTVVDAGGAVQVTYHGIPPDLFRANQSVIATGTMQMDGFVATDLLAKHDETYMPRELKQAMDTAHKDKQIPPQAGRQP